MADNFKMIIEAAIAKAKSDANIKKYVKEIQSEIKDLELDIKVSDSNVKSAIKEVNKLTQEGSSANIKARREELRLNRQKFAEEQFNTKKNFTEQQNVFKANKQATLVDISNRKQALSIQRLQNAEEKLRQQELLKTAKIEQSSTNLTLDKNILSNRIGIFLKENSKLGEEFRQKLVSIQSQIQSSDKTKLSNLTKEFRQVSTAAASMGKTGKNVFDQFKTNILQFLNFFYGAGSVVAAINSVRSLIITVSELDKSLVNLQMATGYTTDKTKELLNTYIDLGQELGATGTEVAEAADVWLRQGKSIAETNELIRDSMILSKIGQIDSAQATTYLTSAMKGYKVEVADVLGIIDKLSAVDLNSATSVSGLAEAMSRTAASADLAGVSMDKLLGMLAVVGEISQKSMDSVGESFKTIFARMGNVKLGKFVDEEGNDITTEISDVETILNKVDIKLRSSATEFRNFGDVLDDVGTNWNSFNQVEQNAIANAFAGVRQRENFIILMSNFADSLKYTEIAAESSGTAMKKFEAYESSVEAKTKTLQASLQELATDTLDSDVVKGFLDFANVLVNATDDVGLFNIALLSLISIVGAKTGLFKSFVYEIGNIMMAQTGWTASTYAQAYAQVGLTGAIKATGVAIKTLMATNPVGWILAITAAIGGLFALQDALTVSLEEQKEKTADLQAEYDGLQNKLSTVNSELDKTKQRMDELNGKDSLTIIEQQELDKLKDTNEQLESQNRLLQKQADIKNRELADSIAIEYQKDFSEDYMSLTKTNTYQVGKDTYTSPAVITEEEHVKELISEYERLSKINKAFISDEDAKKLEQYNSLLVDYGVKVNDYADRYKIDDATSQSWRDFAVLIDKTLNPDEYSSTATDAIVEGAGSVAKSAEELASELEATNKSIDDYQSSLKSISTALSDVSNLSSSDLIDLMQEFSNFDWSAYGVTGAKGVGDITGALKELTRQQYNNLDSTLKSKEALKQMRDETLKSAESIVKFSEDISSNEQKSEDFYDAVLSNLSDTIKTQAESYDLDFDNYKNLIEAKQALDEEYARQQQALVNAQMNFQNVMYSGDVARIKQLGLEYAKVQKSFNDYFGLTTDFSASVDLTNDTYNKKDKVELPEEYISKKADLEHRRNMGLSDETYFSELAQLEKDYLKGHKEYQSEIWSIDEAIYKHNQDLADKTKENAKDDIKSKFDENEHKLAMGLITEEEYYKQLEYLNDTYYKNDKDNQDAYLSNLEKLHDYDVKLVEDANKKKVATIDKIISKYSELRNAINNSAEGKTGDAQVDIYSDGIKSANQAIKYIQGEINKLNKKKITATFTQDDYDSQLATLQSALSEAYSSIDDFNKGISESVQQDQEDIFKAFETGFEKEQKYWEDQKDAYNEIIDAQKEILALKKKQNDYEKDIADKTKDISQIESRMAELSKAAFSGDRQAKAELKKLEEDLAEKKEDLTDAQADREYDLSNDTLDKAKKDNDKIADIKLEAIKTEYETQKANQEALFKQLTELTTNAKNYTISEYSSAIDTIAAKFAQSGIMLGENYTDGLKTVQAQKNNNADGVYSILGKKSNLNIGKASGLSDLNQYLSEQGYATITKAKMVELAKALGMPEIDSIEDVQDTTAGRINKNLILNELKKILGKSTFSNGGKVSIAKLLGEDGFAAVKRDELIFNQDGSKIFSKDLAPLMKDFVQTFKPVMPDFSKFVTNNSSPNISITIPIQGNADSSTVTALNNASNNIAQQVAKALINVSRTK